MVLSPLSVPPRGSCPPREQTSGFEGLARLKPMLCVSCGCSPLGEAVPASGFVFPPGGPLDGEPACAGVALAVLRAYAPGVETARVAQLAGLERDHAEQALLYLQSRGFADSRTRKIAWYHGHREAHMWVEVPRGEFLGKPMPRYEETPTEAERIPPRLWWMFWSGLDPMFLRLPDHAVYVASRLLAPEGSRRYMTAETWALKHLPTWALRKILTSRGYQRGPVAERIKLRLSRGF